jgi:hypothetical protein
MFPALRTIGAGLRATGPNRDFVELQPLVSWIAEYHRAEPSIANR